MFKLKSRKAAHPLSVTPPTVANIVDLSILTTHASIIESFSDDLLKQFDYKRSTIVAMPYYSEVKFKSDRMTDNYSDEITFLPFSPDH